MVPSLDPDSRAPAETASFIGVALGYFYSILFHRHFHSLGGSSAREKPSTFVKTLHDRIPQ